MIQKSNFKSIIQFITYAFIGFSNVLIDIVVFNILWKLTGQYTGTSNYLFKFISFSIYSTSGYLLNLKFTFKETASFKSYFSYVSLLAILGYAEAIILVKLTTLNPFGLPKVLNANIDVLLAAMIMGSIGFLINKLVIFRKKILAKIN